MPIVPSVVLGVKSFRRPLQGASYANHEIWRGFLCWVWKEWQVFFLQGDRKKKILVSHALVEPLHLCSKRGNLYPLLLRLSGPLRLLWGTECGESNVAGFLKWDQTRWLGFLLVLSHLRHEPLEPLCEKSDHTGYLSHHSREIWERERGKEKAREAPAASVLTCWVLPNLDSPMWGRSL